MQRKYSSCRFARLVSDINSSTFIHILIELIVSFVLLANFFSSIFSRSTMSAWTSSTLNALHTASEQQSCRSCRTVNTVDHCRFNKVSPRGRRDDIPQPMAVRRRHYRFAANQAFRVSPWIKNRGGFTCTSLHGRVRSPHISGGRRWLCCRQPACL